MVICVRFVAGSGNTHQTMRSNDATNNKPIMTLRFVTRGCFDIGLYLPRSLPGGSTPVHSADGVICADRVAFYLITRFFRRQ
jgi:hypothetical protein